jgi:hypothetical protein
MDFALFYADGKSAGPLSEQPQGQQRGTERGVSYEKSGQNRLKSSSRRE